MAGDFFHVCQVPRSSSSIKRGFPTHGEKFPSFNLPCAYLGYIHLLYQPTMKFQALPPLSVSALKHINCRLHLTPADAVYLTSQQPGNENANIQMQKLPKHIQGLIPCNTTWGRKRYGPS